MPFAPLWIAAMPQSNVPPPRSADRRANRPLPCRLQILSLRRRARHSGGVRTPLPDARAATIRPRVFVPPVHPFLRLPPRSAPSARRSGGGCAPAGRRSGTSRRAAACWRRSTTISTTAGEKDAAMPLCSGAISCNAAFPAGQEPCADGQGNGAGRNRVLAPSRPARRPCRGNSGRCARSLGC